MKTRPLLQLAAIEAAVASSLPLVYAAASTRCGARVGCFLRNGFCTMDCADPISQMPAFLMIGAIAGIAPAVAGTILFAARPRLEQRRLVQLGLSIAVLVLAAPAYALLFNPNGIVLGLLSLPAAAGLLVALNTALSADSRSGPGFAGAT